MSASLQVQACFAHGNDCVRSFERLCLASQRNACGDRQSSCRNPLSMRAQHSGAPARRVEGRFEPWILKPFRASPCVDLHESAFKRTRVAWNMLQIGVGGKDCGSKVVPRRANHRLVSGRGCRQTYCWQHFAINAVLTSCVGVQKGGGRHLLTACGGRLNW